MGASSGNTKHSLPSHSPLGASGASRWMSCPGSVGQSEGVEDEESDFAVEGTAAHALVDHCLTNKDEPWRRIGTHYLPAERVLTTHSPVPDDAVLIGKDMADAVQLYLHEIEEWHPDRHQGNSWVERKFYCPDIHPLFYGTSDFVYLEELVDQETGEIIKILHVWDYKHGAGIVVEAPYNPQCMYYAAGALEDLGLWNEVERVVVHIIQPRGWHMDGPHRVWEMTTDYLDEWLFKDLVPAMDVAMVSRDTTAGSWCRFCPARSRQCPALMQAMEELQELIIMVIENEEKGAKALTPAQLGRLLDLKELGKIVFKAAESTAYGMLQSGVEVPGAKLVKARTNREYKEGAEKAAVKTFGKTRCYTKPALMSPAQLDALPGGKDFTARWAFKPEGKLTVATEGDPRRRVSRNAKDLFTKKGK